MALSIISAVICLPLITFAAIGLSKESWYLLKNVCEDMPITTTTTTRYYHGYNHRYYHGKAEAERERESLNFYEVITMKVTAVYLWMI